MFVDFNKAFNPSPEQEAASWEKYKEIFNELCKRRGCLTCKHTEHKYTYPTYITGEECVCNLGLECDTVLGAVQNCDKYEQRECETGG